MELSTLNANDAIKNHYEIIRVTRQHKHIHLKTQSKSRTARMWGSLRKGIGENVIAKIGDVVAPPADDDYEYESGSASGSEEEYYDDDDDGEEEEDDVSPSEMRQNVGKLFGGFKNAINQTAKNLVQPDHNRDVDIDYDYNDGDRGLGLQVDEDEDENAWDDDEIGVSFESEQAPMHKTTHMERDVAIAPLQVNGNGNDNGNGNGNGDPNFSMDANMHTKSFEVGTLGNSNEEALSPSSLPQEETEEDMKHPPSPPPIIADIVNHDHVQTPDPISTELIVDSEIDDDADPFGEREESNLQYEHRSTPNMEEDQDRDRLRAEEEAMVQAKAEEEAKIQAEEQQRMEETHDLELELERQRLEALRISQKEQEERQRVKEEAEARLQFEREERERILAEQEALRLQQEEEERDRWMQQEEEEALRLHFEKEELRRVEEERARKEEEEALLRHREEEEARRAEEEKAQQEEQARLEAEQEALRIRQDEEDDILRLKAEQDTIARVEAEREAVRIKQEEEEKTRLMAAQEEQARIETRLEAETPKEEVVELNHVHVEQQQNRSLEFGDDEMAPQQYIQNIEAESKVQEMAVVLVAKDTEIEELRCQFEQYREQMEQKHLVEMEKMNAKTTQDSLSLEMKDADIESLRRHLEECQQQADEQQAKELAPLQDTINRAMLELDARDTEISNLRQHFEERLDGLEAQHKAQLLTAEQNVSNQTKEVDSKNADIKKMRSTINNLLGQLKSKADEHDEVDKEADELNQMVEDLEASNEKLKRQLKEFEGNSKDAAGLQIELHLLKEERDREVKKVLSLQESKESNQAVLTAQRDAAKAQVLDLEQRLAASQADFQVAKTDYDRSIIASSNLQTAMEAFEIEREAEFELLGENRISTEEAMTAAHELALETTRKENDRIIQEAQVASNKAVTNMMEEVKGMEHKQEEYRKENVNLRRSLDEAISRLQSKEEDVIDRALIKSILLDWHSKSGKAKRDVLMVMSSILHFDEKEKQKCGLTSGPHNSISGRMVDTLAPPFPTSGTSPEDLDGDNIREKWVSFLLSECGDSPSKESSSKKRTGRRTTETTAI